MLKSLFLFCLIFLGAHSHVHWWENSKVQELTTPNFYEFVGKSQHVIVEFYAPWCFYCQAMFQQYEDLRNLYNGENPKRKDVLIAKINGNAHEAIPQIYGIYSYPTILHFPPGKEQFDSIFQNQRTKDSMSNWIEHIAGPEKVEEIKQEEKKEEIIANVEIVEKIVENVEKKEKVEKIENGEKKENVKKVEKVENKEKAIEIIETVENGVKKEERYLAEDRKMMDILITVADELKFLDKMQKENTDRVMNELDHVKTIVKSKEKLQEALNYQSFSNGLNMKHASIFFMLGVLLGLGLAFTIMKFRRLSTHIIPIKNV